MKQRNKKKGKQQADTAKQVVPPEAADTWRHVPWETQEEGLGFALLLTNHSRGCVLNSQNLVIEYQRNESVEFCLARALSRPLSFVKDMLKVEDVSTAGCVTKDDFVRRYLSHALDPSNSREKAACEPRRPKMVVFDSVPLQRDSQRVLQLWGVRSATQPLSAAIRRRLAKELYMVHCGRNMDDLLLRVPGMSVDLVARFFKSASKFYHAGPAELARIYPDYFQSSDCGLYMKHSPGFTQPSSWTYEDMRRHGLESVDFVSRDAVPLPEERAMLEHGWKLAGGVEGFLNEGHNTFPYTTVEPESEEDEEEECGGARRPIPAELAWLIYAMVAIRKWVKRGHLRCVGVDDDGLPAYDPHTFSIKLGEETVRIRFPTVMEGREAAAAPPASPATADGPDSTAAAAGEPPLPDAGMQRCAMCAKQVKGRNTDGKCGVQVKWCSRCREVGYCSPACQREHWPAHKPACAPASITASERRPAGGVA
ncbi:MYND finger domain containing protein [Acanthamoeba castellanii str. Neff]|uniref:MYND finger domain containing protein n=1 Tax=Acanthamoeba castellanii (strain ATCC 30010 / Neff) TaxID=1257118 RepID=L8GJS3_ACACF|nr:MYND finger domain containing protein [Acanthamoeba castellanii str. Neff]ELR13325.1 MYND finger domain containing protein [Acanthamoeba castellanii str. Neff]